MMRWGVLSRREETLNRSECWQVCKEETGQSRKPARRKSGELGRWWGKCGHRRHQHTDFSALPVGQDAGQSMHIALHEA